MIELILLAKKKKEFSSISELVISRVGLLSAKVETAVKEKDPEKGDHLTEIFVELGLSNMK